MYSIALQFEAVSRLHIQRTLTPHAPTPPHHAVARVIAGQYCTNFPVRTDRPACPPLTSEPRAAPRGGGETRHTCACPAQSPYCTIGTVPLVGTVLHHCVIISPVRLYRTARYAPVACVASPRARTSRRRRSRASRVESRRAGTHARAPDTRPGEREREREARPNRCRSSCVSCRHRQLTCSHGTVHRARGRGAAPGKVKNYRAAQ